MVVVNTHTKWLVWSSIMAEAMVRQFKQMFSTLGLLKILVIDNAPILMGITFWKFMRCDVI